MERTRSSRPERGPHAEAGPITGLVEYQEGSIVSRTLVKNENGSVTLFAFDQSQELSEHTAPFEAVAYVVDGEAEIQVAGAWRTVGQGSVIVMPAGVPHAVKAARRFKMLLAMVKTT